jgi:hypothetical protein
MLDTQDFQISGATISDEDATASVAPLKLPATLGEIAEYEGLKETSLRNKWFSQKVVPIYDGYECPALRTDNGKYVTEFGYQAFKRFHLKVVTGRMNYETYIAEIRSKLVPIQPEIEQPKISPQTSTSALIRRSSSLVRREFKQADSSSLTAEISADVETLVDVAETNLGAFEAALVQRFEARGSEVGAIAFERYQVSLQETFTKLATASEKKQDVAVSEVSS